MAVEGAPKSAWFLRSKETHIENAIAIAILKRADRPKASGHFETEDPRGPWFNPDLLNGLFEKPLRLP